MFVVFLGSPEPAQKKIRISCTVLTGPKWEGVVSSVPDPNLVKLRNPKSSKVSDPVFIEFNGKLRSTIGRRVLIGLKRKGNINSNAVLDPDFNEGDEFHTISSF